MPRTSAVSRTTPMYGTPTSAHDIPRCPAISQRYPNDIPMTSDDDRADRVRSKFKNRFSMIQIKKRRENTPGHVNGSFSFFLIPTISQRYPTISHDIPTITQRCTQRYPNDVPYFALTSHLLRRTKSHSSGSQRSTPSVYVCSPC